MDSTNVNVGQNSNTNWDLNLQANLNAASDVDTQNASKTNFQTTISTSQATASPSAKAYVNDSNKPFLSPTTSTADPKTAQATLQHLFDFDTILQGIIQNTGAPLPGSAADEASQALDNIPVDDPEIIAQAQKQGISPGKLLNGVQGETQFLAQQQFKDLPEDVSNKLEYAFNNPEAAESLSPALKNQLDNIKQNVNQQLKQEYGFSKEWKGIPTDNSTFNKNVTNQFDESFESHLADLKESGQVTAQQAKQLTSLHYGSLSKSNVDPKLLQTSQDLESAATSDINAKYSSNGTLKPQADSAFNNAVLNGKFQATFQAALTNANPPLSAQDQAQVIKAYSDPDNPSIPPNFKQTAQTMKSAATNTLIKQESLDSTWTPTVASPVPATTPKTLMASSFLSTAQSVVAQANTLVSQMPAGPEQINFADYLKTVSAAVNKLQDILYVIQIDNSNSDKGLSDGKLDTSLNQIAMQSKQAKKVEDKLAKMASLGPLKSLFEWLIKIIMLVLSAVLGPIMLAMTLTYFIDSAQSEARHTTSLIDQMFQDITTKMGAGGGLPLKIALCFVLSGANPLLLMTLFSQDSQVAQNFVAMCGGDKNAQSIAGAVFSMTMEMAIMLPLLFLSGGTLAPAEAAPLIVHACNLSLEDAMMTVKIANIAFQAIMASLDVSQDAVSMNNDILNAQIDIIKAIGDAYNTKVTALIRVMQSVIQGIIDDMNTRSKFILDLSNFQTDVFSQAGEINSSLFG